MLAYLQIQIQILTLLTQNSLIEVDDVLEMLHVLLVVLQVLLDVISKAIALHNFLSLLVECLLGLILFILQVGDLLGQTSPLLTEMLEVLVAPLLCLPLFELLLLGEAFFDFRKRQLSVVQVDSGNDCFGPGHDQIR